ncbi:hypothetical protein ACHAQJ_004711 [Trichoderma viride]
MSPLILLLAALLALTTTAFAQFNIGPASFLWPPPRLWNRTVDNIPPCGSLDGSGPRAKFPMDPKSVADFVPLTSWSVSKLDVGIACIKIPDAASHVEAGDKATFQLRYFSDYDSPTNQSFFACADITYVNPADVAYPFPCVNTTEPEMGPNPVAPTTTGKEQEPKPTGEEWSAGEKSSLSKDKIAAIGIGGGLGITVVALCFWLKLIRRKERRLDAERKQEESEWQSQTISDGAYRPRLRVRYGSYGLQDMSHVLPRTSPASASEHANRNTVPT